MYIKWQTLSSICSALWALMPKFPNKRLGPTCTVNMSVCYFVLHRDVTLYIYGFSLTWRNWTCTWSVSALQIPLDEIGHRTHAVSKTIILFQEFQFVCVNIFNFCSLQINCLSGWISNIRRFVTVCPSVVCYLWKIWRSTNNRC